jgi:predicted nucleic acid-binding protein
LIDEVAEKLALPRIRAKYALTDTEVQSLIVRLSQAAYLVPGQIAVIPEPPDRDDTKAIAAAVEAAAQYVVTGDKALLGFSAQSPCPIVTPRHFWDESLPRSLAVTLTYPVFVLEHVPGLRYYTVGVENHDCLAVFTNPHAAEFYRRRENLLGQDRSLADRVELMAYLERVSQTGCEWVAFNPIGRYSVIQPIHLTIECLRSTATTET